MKGYGVRVTCHRFRVVRLVEHRESQLGGQSWAQRGSKASLMRGVDKSTPRESGDESRALHSVCGFMECV